MKHRLLTLLITLSSLCITSCGLIDMEFDPFTQQISDVSFVYDTVYVMKGDTFFLAPYFSPDTVNNSSFFMRSCDDDVVRVQTDTILASGEGSTLLIATSASGDKSDTCTVIVMKPWQVTPYEYPNDMVVYAHITFDGNTPPSRMVFGSFCDDEPRGVAIPMKEDRSLYRFRIWSNSVLVNEEAFGEDIYFRGYDPLTLQVYEFPLELPFTGQTHGTPSKPIELAR